MGRTDVRARWRRPCLGPMQAAAMSRTCQSLAATLALALGALLFAPVAQSSAATCGGKHATIVGTPGNDVIVGKKASDVIYGGGGNDRISGGPNGNDTICGGPGDDNLRGKNGFDSLYGGGGDDKLYGESGTDRLGGGGRHEPPPPAQRGRRALRGPPGGQP